MSIVAERFIELCILERKRPLTKQEVYELNEALDYLERLEWEKAKLKNLSLMASMTNDTEWQHELCKELDQIN